MNEIFQRKSIRKYRDKPVSKEDLKKIMSAGMAAPSAGNQQPWHFIAVSKKDSLAELSKVSPYAKMLKDAAAGLIVCGDLDKERHKGYWPIDCSAATQNMLLEITHLELGAVWLGIYPRKDRVKFLKTYFNLPDTIQPFSLISLGYPGEEKPITSRYDESRIHWEKW